MTGVTIKPRQRGRVNPDGMDLREKVVYINRVAKVVKGGRRFSFSAVVVLGDGRGNVGFATGKAREVPEAIRKAVEHAKRNLVPVPRVGGTIPHPVIGRKGSGKVLLRPAGPGTGLIAQGAVRAVLELGGITDALTKNLGSHNAVNVVAAVFDGLAHLRTREEIEALRGVVLPRPRKAAAAQAPLVAAAPAVAS